eukprot:12973817-Alexandrium_andersonii.AAC.1
MLSSRSPSPPSTQSRGTGTTAAKACAATKASCSDDLGMCRALQTKKSYRSCGELSANKYVQPSHHGKRSANSMDIAASNACSDRDSVALCGSLCCCSSSWLSSECRGRPCESKSILRRSTNGNEDWSRRSMPMRRALINLAPACCHLPDTISIDVCRLRNESRSLKQWSSASPSPKESSP